MEAGPSGVKEASAEGIFEIEQGHYRCGCSWRLKSVLFGLF